MTSAAGAADLGCKRAAVVVDLGFGDAGKGLVTDYLVRTYGASLVVRWNGGAQAGHNVVTSDGRHHTFAQLGAGAFVPGVRAHLAEGFVLHPTALGFEAAHLAEQGVPDALERLSVDERALVVSPFHQAANRLRELVRGPRRHGSCGVGVGEAVAHALACPDDALRAGDLRAPATLLRKAARQQSHEREELASAITDLRGHPAAAAEIDVLCDASVVGRWVEASIAVAARVSLVGEDFLRRVLTAGMTVFEGAQGVLLDEWLGLHPHTTYSTCTFEGAQRLLRGCAYDGEVARIGVLRAYLVRHGAGPLPTEDAALAASLPEPHNRDGPWQGAVRRGFPDTLLERYAAAACGGLDAVALTHLDALDRVPVWRVCRAYRLQRPEPGLFETAGDPREAVAIEPPRGRDLARQAALTSALAGARPVYVEDDAPARHASAIELHEQVLQAAVKVTSWGPCAGDVKARGALFGGTPTA